MRTALDFFFEHGRLPKLGDDPAPWTYKGWTLPYVQAAHGRLCPDRWGHWSAVVEAGRLLDEPIPRVSFTSAGNSPELRAVFKWLDVMETRSRWGAMEALIDWLAWGLGVVNEQPHVEPSEAEKLYRTLDLKPWLSKPSDYLGAVLAEQLGAGWNPHAFFPTPHELCEMLVSVTVLKRCDEDLRRATVHDPCCGTGRMLLHASNYSYRLSGQDIDPLMCKVTKINGALYAPWLAFPFPFPFMDQTLQEQPKAPPAKGQMELWS